MNNLPGTRECTGASDRGSERSLDRGFDPSVRFCDLSAPARPSSVDVELEQKLGSIESFLLCDARELAGLGARRFQPMSSPVVLRSFLAELAHKHQRHDWQVRVEDGFSIAAPEGVWGVVVRGAITPFHQQSGRQIAGAGNFQLTLYRKEAELTVPLDEAQLDAALGLISRVALSKPLSLNSELVG